jgi:kinesin family protein C1
MRTPSLNAAFANLSISPHQLPLPSTKKHRPSLEDIEEELSPTKVSKYSCIPSLRHTQSLRSLQTPSRVRQTPSVFAMRFSAPVIRSKPPPTFFLTKETLTRTTAWDTQGRLDDMERMYSRLRSQMESASDSKNAIEESLSMYKTRGMYRNFDCVALPDVLCSARDDFGEP